VDNSAVVLDLALQMPTSENVAHNKSFAWATTPSQVSDCMDFFMFCLCFYNCNFEEFFFSCHKSVLVFLEGRTDMNESVSPRGNSVPDD
jgi:hypothetical protein